MKQDVTKVQIQNEMDLVLSYKRAKQLAEFCGMNSGTQTKFGTAVSEICRNVIEHVGVGTILFNIVDEGRLYLEALVIDLGRGIDNVEALLSKKNSHSNNKGCGIPNSRKLVDTFSIQSSPDKGTKVSLRMIIPSGHPPINRSIIAGWKHYFESQTPVSPYEEIKKQNTELLEALEDLRVKNNEVEEQFHEIKRLNTELDKFAYTVSHDLKAPLNNIYGIIEVIEEGLNGDIGDARMGTKMLVDQVKRMDRLINDILSYSKSGKLKVPKAKVNVYKLVNDVINSLKVPSEFVFQVDANLPTLITEEVFLNQVFSNLLSNAVKYNDKVEGKIAIRYKEEESVIVFAVEDNGPGVLVKNQKSIFNAFELVVPERGKDSSGIGLSIVKNIVEEKGGKIWVESDGKKGSIFYFTWPKSEKPIADLVHTSN